MPLFRFVSLSLAVLCFVLLSTLCARQASASSAVQDARSVALTAFLATGFSVTSPTVEMSDESAQFAAFRSRRVGRGLVGFALGIQAFQITFAIVMRAFAGPIGPWAAGDSLVIEGLVSLVSIAAAPMGVVGFSKLAEDRMRGAGVGLLEGGIYALSYAGLHLMFSGISAALPSGGQGGGFAEVLVGIPMMSQHFIVGAGMCIAGAVVLAKHRRGSLAALSAEDAEVRGRRAERRPLLFPVPLVSRDGAGLSLVAVF
jgi:hypothetical protein